MINSKIVKQKIHEKWLPKLEARYKTNGVTVSEGKLKKIAEMCHTRKIYESAYANLGNVFGRGAFAFGNNPMNPSDYSRGSAEVFQNLFGVFVDTAAITFGLDLLPLVPMTKSNLTLFIAEPIYTNGRIDNADQKPYIFQVKHVQTGTPTALVKGTEYTIKTANSGGENVMKVIFMGKHRLNTHDCFQIVEVYDNSAIPGTNWKLKSVAECLTTPNGIYVDGSNYHRFDDTTTDYIDGFNNFVGGYIGAGKNDDNDWFMNRGDGTNFSKPMGREKAERTYYRSMGLRTWSKNFAADTFHVDIEYTTEQVQDMKMDHDVDALELGDTVLQDQLNQGLNDHILGTIFAHGWSHHYDLHQYNGFNLNAFLAASSSYGNAQTFLGREDILLAIDGPSGVLPSTGAIAENLSSLQRRIVSRMLYASAVVNNRSRKGKADTGVLNGTYATAIKDVRGYTPAPFENDLNNNGLAPFGSFYGINVYEDGLMDLTDERISIFRKGTDKDPGIKICPYILGEKIVTIAEGTMSTKEALKSRYALAEVGSNPQTNYITFTVQQDSGYAIV